MKKTLGILSLLIFVFLLTALMSEPFLSSYNLENLIRRTSLFGIISIGVAFVIITGGIDLSIGSVICLIGCGLPFCLQVNYQEFNHADISRIDSQSGTITLNQSLSDMASGDRIRLSGSHAENTGIYQLTEQLNDTTWIATPKPPRDSDTGQVVQLFPVTTRNSESKSIRIEKHSLTPRDRINFIGTDGTLGQTVRAMDVVEDEIILDNLPETHTDYAVLLDRKPRMSVPMALSLVLLVSLGIGLWHGFMVAKMKLQPFVVTLCGLLLYRGITRGFTQDQTQGFSDEYPILRQLATAEIANVTTAMAFGLIGGLLLAVATGWFLIQRKRKQKGSFPLWPPVVTALLGMGIMVSGIYKSIHQPIVPTSVTENESFAVDLPEGTRKVSLEGRADSGQWSSLTELPISDSSTSQQLRVPSLESIRKQVPGNWKTVRVKVIERDLPEIGIPAPFIILVLVAVAAGIFLNQTIYGRYLLALGRNEEAAKYSGINTSRMIILAYVICSLCAGLGGLLFVLDVNSAQPVDFGNFYELYAIAAAVLGGCSLRGGEGTILGVVIGAALMRVLKNMITLVDWIPTHIEYAIIGAVILAGVTADELVKRIAANRRDAALRKEA